MKKHTSQQTQQPTYDPALTEKQKNVFEFIQKNLRKTGRSPTYLEIQTHFGFQAVGTVQHYIETLIKKGYLQSGDGKWSSLRVVRRITPLTDFRSPEIPLLGKVAAGFPIEYLKNGEQIEVPSLMIKTPGDYFALQVSGDSMIDEGILDGDLVVVRKESSAENGKIIVASIDNESTIKRFFKKRNTIELHSANPKYQPLIVGPHQQFRIEGLYLGLMRF